MAPDSHALADAVDSPLDSQPVIASAWRRVLSWVVDYAVVMVPGVSLVTLAVASLIQGLPGYVGAVAAEVGWSGLIKLITHGGTGIGGIGTAASKEWIGFAMPLIGAILFVPLLQFGYQATLLAWRGRTFGKVLIDTRVAMVGKEASRLKRPLALRRAFSTTLLETGLVSMALVVMIVGELLIGAVLWAFAVIAFWANALVVLGPGGRTIIDRLSGTVVVRRGFYSHVAVQASDLARSATAAAAVAGRKGSEFAVTAGRKASVAASGVGRSTSDAVAAAGRTAREGVGGLARSAPIQQVRTSRVARRAKALSASSADQARLLGENATGGARRIAERAQRMWENRQAKRGQQNAEPPEPSDGTTPTPSEGAP